MQTKDHPIPCCISSNFPLSSYTESAIDLQALYTRVFDIHLQVLCMQITSLPSLPLSLSHHFLSLSPITSSLSLSLSLSLSRHSLLHALNILSCTLSSFSMTFSQLLLSHALDHFSRTLSIFSIFHLCCLHNRFLWSREHPLIPRNWRRSTGRIKFRPVFRKNGPFWSNPVFASFLSVCWNFSSREWFA